MRIRMQDANGDYSFGQGSANFFINTPAGVGQLIQTRLLLLQGEWFLDTSAGTPYSTEILGTNTQPFYDLAVRSVILNTPGVTKILAYSSSLTSARKLTITATVLTQYSTTPVELSL